MFRTKLKGELNNKDIKQCACILPISVGQKYHENDKFAATIELINSNFGECTIVVADTLARHTSLKELEDDTDETIRQKLCKKGNEWIDRNAEALKKLTITHKIVRWDEYLMHQKYQEKRDQVESLYKTDKEFRKAVEGAMAVFLRRFKNQRENKEGSFDESKAFKHSLEYVKEECAVLLLWPDTEKCDFLIYPNKLHQAMYNLRRRFIAPDNGDSTKLQPLVVEFKKVKQSLELNGSPENHLNGHSYVSQYMSGTKQTINPAMFFQAKPPINMTMSKAELFEFIESHLKMIRACTQSMTPQASFEFLKYTFTHINSIIYSITITNNSDSDSSDHNNEHSPSTPAATNP
ncbi:MAG: hypothetical protein AMJ43_01325 [Coxiella sp. DG_40]|nr:MAG: hypothetical protein AMJ43_01325 [Coxiella sp. DG_40]